MKKSALILTGFTAGLFLFALSSQAQQRLARIEAPISTPAADEHSVVHTYGVQGWAGNYLSGRYGQRSHDWENASQFISRVLDNHPDDPLLVKRAMVLAMGSGNTDMAFALAKRDFEMDDDKALALIFLSTQAFHEKDYKKAKELIDKIPETDVSAFMIPMLRSWAEAATGTYNAGKLTGNTIHIHHAILIADFLGQHEHIEHLLEKALENPAISNADKERVADLYAHIGQTETAKKLYADILQDDSSKTDIQKKLDTINSGGDMQIFKQIKQAEIGVAQAFHDTAQTLHLEYNDDSARLFAHMAHYLNPDNTPTKILLSEIASRYERVDEAIKYLSTLPEQDKQYIPAQRRIAELLVDAGRTEEALATLQNLADTYGDPDFYIQIGDIYRNEEDFKKSLKAYNDAAAKFGKTIPPEYWHLLYVRGISYERLGQWDKAERDLKAALAHEPEHPFVLNYLAYAWADQGINLNESLNMLRTAAALRPSDGYITDSLGWVLFRMGKFEDSVPHLEKAVELLPYDPVINDHLGDAYWRVGRKLEARFQWERAKNHIVNDDVFLSAIDEKISNGLPYLPVTREAQSGQAGKEMIQTR